MDLEKTLFRIHERVLSQESVSSAVRVLKIAFGCLGLILLAIFFYANSVHRKNTGCVGQIYDNFSKEKLDNKYLPDDTVIFINICSYNKTAQPSPMGYYNYTYYDLPPEDLKDSQKQANDTTNGSDQNANKNEDNDPKDIDNNHTIQQQNQTTVLPSFINPKQKQLRSHCIEYPRIQTEHTAILQSLSYPRDMRVIRNITTAVIYVEPSCYSSNYLLDRIVYGIIGIEPILINEIIENFKYSDIHVRNLVTEESWNWSPLIISSYEVSSIGAWIFKFFVSFIRINLGIFYTSAVSALYIKISIICSPVFILLIMFCMRCLGNHDVSVATLTQTFPYIGIYLQALRGQPSRELVKAFLKMMLMIYFVYLSALYVGSFILFSKSMPKGLDENFLAFIAILELLVLLFVRTRSSLKWFPKVSILFLALFLLYVQNTVYGYYALLLIVVMLFTLSFFCVILEEFEIPGVSWNESFHYAPSVNRPRCLYFPIFNLGWYHDLPQLWTMFYPLYGRDHFTPAQLSLVDSDYILLNQTLEIAERGAPLNNLGIIDHNLNEDRRQGDQQQNPAVPLPNQANLNDDIEMQGNQPPASAVEHQAQQQLQRESEREAIRDAEEGNLLSDDHKSHEQNLLQPNTLSSQFYQGRGIQIGSNETLNRSNDSGDYQKLN